MQDNASLSLRESHDTDKQPNGQHFTLAGRLASPEWCERTLAAEGEFSYQTNLLLGLAVSWHFWDGPGSLWRSMTGIIERTTTHTKHSPNSELPQTEKQPVDHTRIENPGINVVTLHGTCCFSL